MDALIAADQRKSAKEVRTAINEGKETAHSEMESERALQAGGRNDEAPC